MLGVVDDPGLCYHITDLVATTHLACATYFGVTTPSASSNPRVALAALAPHVSRWSCNHRILGEMKSQDAWGCYAGNSLVNINGHAGDPVTARPSPSSSHQPTSSTPPTSASPRQVPAATRVLGERNSPDAWGKELPAYMGKRTPRILGVVDEPGPGYDIAYTAYFCASTPSASSNPRVALAALAPHVSR